VELYLEHPKNKCQSNHTFQGVVAHCFFDAKIAGAEKCNLGHKRFFDTSRFVACAKSSL